MATIAELTTKVATLANEVANATDATVKATKQAELEAAKAELEQAKAEEEAAAARQATPVTYEEVIESLKADTNNKVYKRTITLAEFAQKEGKNGNPYTNAFLTLNKPVIAAVKMPDGTHQMRGLGAIQTPYYSLELVMRRHTYFARFISYIQEAMEIGQAAAYFSNISITVLAEFVPAGVQKSNPFSRKDNQYSVEQYDRYVYHIIGIDAPTDPITIGIYNKTLAVTTDDIFAAIKAKREAAKKKAAEDAALRLAAVQSTSIPDDDIQF